MNATSHLDATQAAVAVISTNMLQQIIALQEAINNREPQQRFPTMQEASLLTKMIVGLEKLKRLIAPPKQSARSRAVADKHADPDEEAFGDGIQQHKSFAGGWEALMALGEAAVDTLPPSEAVEQNSATAPTNAWGTETAVHADATIFPIPETAFSEYRYLLYDTRMDKNHTTLVNGIAYNTNWLQYNLFQYSKPVQDRRFFHNEARYHRKFKHGYICRLIENYLRVEQTK